MTFTRHKFLWTKEKASFADSETVLVISNAGALFPPTLLYSVKTKYFFKWDLQICGSWFQTANNSAERLQFISLMSISLWIHFALFCSPSKMVEEHFICLWRITLSTGFDSCSLCYKISLTFIFELRGSWVANVKQNEEQYSSEEF